MVCNQLVEIRWFLAVDKSHILTNEAHDVSLESEDLKVSEGKK